MRNRNAREYGSNLVAIMKDFPCRLWKNTWNKFFNAEEILHYELQGPFDWPILDKYRPNVSISTPFIVMRRIHWLSGTSFEHM